MGKANSELTLLSGRRLLLYREIELGVEESLLILREFGQVIAENRLALVAMHTEFDIRIFELLLKPYSAAVRMFEDVSDAEAWLGAGLAV